MSIRVLAALGLLVLTGLAVTIGYLLIAIRPLSGLMTPSSQPIPIVALWNSTA